MNKTLLSVIVYFSFLYSVNVGAASYAYYGGLGDAAKQKDWNEVLSYKYAKGKLLIIQKDGKTLDLKDGVYEFDDGSKYVVKDGAVIDKEAKGKKSRQLDKKDKKDKLKDLKL